MLGNMALGIFLVNLYLLRCIMYKYTNTHTFVCLFVIACMFIVCLCVCMVVCTYMYNASDISDNEKHFFRFLLNSLVI